MRRVNVSIVWLLLLLVPAVAAAQKETVNRSRARSEANRTEQVDRSVKQTRSVERKATKQKKDERPRLREHKASRSQSSRAVKEGAGDRSGRSGVHRSDRKPERKAAHNDRSRRVRQAPERNERIRHKPVRHPKPKVVRHHADVRRRIARATHRFDRRHVRRYVYRDRRYHRRHVGRLSIGFYIRIPSIRWHAGASRRFVYRQVVTGHPAGALEVRSTFRRKIRSVHRDYVEVEFELDRIGVTAAGRYLGQVNRFPGSLRRVRAKVYSDGFVEFDRMLYVAGNQFTGFELLSTRHCGGDLIGATYGCLDPRSGELDFYRERVNSTRYSRLLDPVQLGDVVPVALVPDEEYLGFQYVVGYRGGSDGYYSGSFDYSSLNSFDADGTAHRASEGPELGGFVTDSDAREAYDQSGVGFAHESTVSFDSRSRGTIALQHRAEIRYLDN